MKQHQMWVAYGEFGDPMTLHESETQAWEYIAHRFFHIPGTDNSYCSDKGPPSACIPEAKKLGFRVRNVNIPVSNSYFSDTEWLKNDTATKR